MSILARDLNVRLKFIWLIFSSLYNNIVPPSNLPQRANYYLFKVSPGPLIQGWTRFEF